MRFRASAPGSIMLLGEYAVLHGKHALVCAVDKRMQVTLTPRSDNQIVLQSALGHFQTTVKKINVIPPFQFVLATLKFFKKNLTQGCDIQIESEFSHQIGFASSAAVTVATLSAVSTWLNIPYTREALAEQARKIILSVQKIGSGADAAACAMGGIVCYRAKPYFIEKLPNIHPISLIYSGSKTPTVDAIKWVEKRFARHSSLFKSICQSIEGCVLQGKQAIVEKNWQELGELMNVQQGLMDALGVNTEVLNQLITTLRQQKQLLGVKISGSGLGDCVVALGEADPIENIIPAQITSQGVICEKI